MANVVLAEAAAISPSQLTGKVWRVKIIKGDTRGSSAFYPASVVEAGAPLFTKGTRIYGDHPTSDEKWSRPERSYRDIVGVFESDAEFENGDLYTNARFFTKHQEEIKEMAEAGVIGMSIRASGDVEETADGPVLKAFTSVTSVDVVTTAGAGGGFETLLESARNSSGSASVPESPKEKESVVDEAMKTALDQLIEAVKSLPEAVKVLTERAAKEDADKAAALEEAAKADAPKVPTYAEIDKALVESELPQSARASVITAVEGGADLSESIAAKKAEVEALLSESSAGFSGHVRDEGKEKSLEEATGAAVINIFG